MAPQIGWCDETLGPQNKCESTKDEIIYWVQINMFMRGH